MNRNSTLIGLFSLLAIIQYSPLAATVYVDNGTANSYTLNAGDSLHIASGTYTGTIVSFAAGAKISVASAATFQPVSMAFPNVRGTIYVYGTFIMNTQLRTNTGFQIHNYGVTTVNATTLMSGSTQLWTNYFGGIMNLNGDVSMTNDNAIYNQGTINCSANFTQTGTTTITNKLYINITGNYLNNGGVLTNQGRFYVKGSITFNNGLARIYNYCRMIAEAGIYNTTGQLSNYGFLWSKSSPGTGVMVNSGSIWNGPGGVILAISLNNTGTITGSGYMYFTGYTTTTNSGVTGVSGPTTDTIKMYDASRNSPLTIYDNQTGTVHPNVVFRAFTALDSNKVYIGGCSIEMVSQIPLAVNWDYFQVSLKENTPMITWSAKSDAGTRFHVQRSYDGRNFYTVYSMESQPGSVEYTHNDLQVNSKASIVYYRILAIETNGAQKFSETRTIRFSNQTLATFQTAPNPFTSSLTINYQSQEPGTITIKLISITGQQQMTKQVSINSGYNSIPVQGVSNLSRGVYLLQVTKGDKLVAAEKVIKQ